ncbi:PD-(D/E)XK nuclease family protein [Actinomyces wuliandei]|uniref:PD-(D/E)XK nuclease family protein n=1 Tax=Actinomyces wuliandei TaxID=2057743 RepID=UPI000FD982AB|nr:PD-(D/E)XK nuclease family protein [Actinomyces wuliandei]
MPDQPDRLRLLPPLPQPGLPALDASGQAVMEHVAGGDNVVVLGAPGTGKTTLALSVLVQAVAAGRDALLLAPTRSRADALRSRAAHLLGGGHGDGTVRVRTPTSLALSVLTTSLTRRADPLPAPVLLAGAEEDAALAPMVATVSWPGLPPQAVGSRAFRSELRNLLARCGELGVSAQDLSRLGQDLGVALWQPASRLLHVWDAQGRPSPRRRAEVRKMDPVRLQDRAGEALEAWDLDGVTEPRPVPDLVVVDDYQDCTAATARFLGALARPDARGRRAQVVVLGDPDVAVETFRGGSPSLLVDAQERSGLAARRLVLRTLHRGNPTLASLWQDQASRLPVTGTGRHRRPDLPALQATLPDLLADPPHDLPPDGPGDRPPAREPSPSGVTALVASSPAQEAAHLARTLREEHVRHGTAWEQMAVVVRSAQHVAAMGRELRRRGVPAGSSTPAVLLREEPAAAALLATARAGLDGRLGAGDVLADRAAALDLLTGPLVGLTALDLRRLRRHLLQEQPGDGTDRELLRLLASPESARQVAQELAGTTLSAQAGLLVVASEVVAAVSGVVAGAGAGTEDESDSGHGGGTDSHSRDSSRDSSGDNPGNEPGRQPGGGLGGGPRRVTGVEDLLWAAWSASGRAEAWRSAALRPVGPPGSPEAAVAQAAEHDLDVVTALFKRAEVWSERNPGALAQDFLSELSAEVLPFDSVAPQGARPGGVAVLTPAAAAGRQWEVVAVAGLVRDSWPDLRLRDSLTRSGLLVDAVTGRLPLDGQGRPTGQEDPAGARHQVRADERRMLLCSLTRASRRLLVTAVSDADHVPSSFFLEVARAAGSDLGDSPEGPRPAEDVGDLTLRGLVAELRRAATIGSLEGASPEERSRADQAARLLAALAGAGVDEASPATWAGLGVPTCETPLVGPGEVVRVSPSDIEALTACPLRWFLSRQGGQPGTSASQTLGTLIHRLAEQAQRRNLRGQALTELAEGVLEELGYPDTWLGGLAARRVRDMVGRLDTYLSGVPGHVEVERSVDVRVDLPAASLGPPAPGQAGDPGEASVPVRLVGRIDRVEYLDTEHRGTDRPDAGHTGAQDCSDVPDVMDAPDAPPRAPDTPLPRVDGTRVRVMDLKTGAVVPDDAAHHPQLASYRLALEALGYDVVGAGLVMLGRTPTRRDDGVVVSPRGAALAPSPDPADGQDWASALVARAAAAAYGPVLQACSGGHCQWCAVKDSCPARPEGRRSWQ